MKGCVDEAWTNGSSLWRAPLKMLFGGKKATRSIAQSSNAQRPIEMVAKEQEEDEWYIVKIVSTKGRSYILYRHYRSGDTYDVQHSSCETRRERVVIQ